MTDVAVKPSLAERIHWDTRIKPTLITLVIAAAAYLIGVYMVAPRIAAAQPDYLPESFLSLPLGHVTLTTAEGGALLPVRLAETTTQRSVGFRDVGETAIDNQFLLYVPSRATTARTSYTVRDVRAPIEFLLFDSEGMAIATHVGPLGATSVSIPEPHRWVLAAEAGSFERLGLEVGTTTLVPDSIVKY